MYNRKRKRKLLMFSLVSIMICMAISYAAFSANLDISGKSTITSDWNVKITDIASGNIVGDAKDIETPTHTNTEASFKAGLLRPGDSITYDIKIENEGTLDAKIKLLNYTATNSDIIKIVSRGVREGQVIKIGEEKHLYITVTFDENYNGPSVEETVEIDVNIDYEQATGSEPDIGDDYIVTYDSKTNGGITENQPSQSAIGANIDLTKTATKEGWTFIGWNIDKDANTPMQNYQMPSKDITVYAIFEKDLIATLAKDTTVNNTIPNTSCKIYNNENSCEITLPDIIPNPGFIKDGWYNGTNKIGNVGDKYTITRDLTLIAKATPDEANINFSTTSTTKTITVITAATALTDITKYEFSVNNGPWIDNQMNNTYTFENLTQDQTYNLTVRITTESGLTKTYTNTAKTAKIPLASFQKDDSIYPKTVTVIAPEGCGTTYTCTYQKNNESPVTITENQTVVSFEDDGELVVYVSDGVSTVSSSYNVKINLKAEDLIFEQGDTNLPCEDAQCALDELKKMINNF